MQEEQNILHRRLDKIKPKIKPNISKHLGRNKKKLTVFQIYLNPFTCTPMTSITLAESWRRDDPRKHVAD